jgi:hypothetical protein
MNLFQAEVRPENGRSAWLPIGPPHQNRAVAETKVAELRDKAAARGGSDQYEFRVVEVLQ